MFAWRTTSGFYTMINMYESVAFFLDFAIKLVVALVATLVVLKLFGMKTQLKQMTPLDIILNFVISAIISSFILSNDFGILQFLGLVAIYGAVMYLISRLTFNTDLGRRFFIGRPRVIIQDGKCNQKMMQRMKIGARDIAAVLRKNKIKSIRDIKTAQIEPGGDLTIVKKGEQNYSLVLIDNGIIVDDALKQLKKSKTWLRNELKKHGIRNTSDVFIAQWGARGLDIVTMN